VIKLGHNVGRLSPWNLFDELGINGRFVFSDPDIVSDEHCPLDATEYSGKIFDTHPERGKERGGDADRMGFDRRCRGGVRCRGTS
jgi:hypothetical protein